MKSLKFIYSLLVVLVAGAIASCTTDNTYTPGDVPAGPQVCFSNKNATVLDISGEPEDDTQYITLTRMVTDDRLEVPISAVMDSSYESLFEIPNIVVFEVGEDVAQLPIKAKSSDMEEDKEYSISLSLLSDSQTTPYGESSWTVAIRLFPWDRFVGELTEYAKLRGGDIFSALDGNQFSILSVNAEVDVEVYTHKSKEGVYLLKNPWGVVAVPVLGATASEDEEESTEAYHLVIDCSNPEKCFIEKRRMGLSSDETKDWYIASDYHPETNPTGIAGVLENGVITWAENGLLIGSPNYKAGHMFTSNLGGGFRVILPGGIAQDYSFGVNYEGSIIASDLSDVKAKFVFTHGADVAGIKYYLADGNVLANPTAAIQALLDGSAENICEVEDFNAGSGTTEINININRADIYTIVAAPKNGVGELVEKSVALDSFYYSGFGSSNDHPCEFTVDFGKYSDHQTDIPDDDIGDYNAFSYIVKGSNLKSFAVSCWPTAFLNEYLSKEGNTYEKLFNAEGVEPFSLEELTAVQSAEGKSSFYGDLEDNTDYTAVFFGINNYETRRALTFDFTTKVAPEYSGDFKMGKYLMKSKSIIKSYETVFEVQSYQGSKKKFVVSNIGYNDGAEFFATYDAEAGTLTLDGTVRGRQKEGNLFGKMFGYVSFDKDGNPVECYQYESQLQEGALLFDPLVINIDKTKKEPIGIQNYLFKVWVYTVKKGKDGNNTTGSLVFGHKDAKEFNNNKNGTTTIVPYVEPTTPDNPDNTGGENAGGENAGTENK